MILGIFLNIKTKGVLCQGSSIGVMGGLYIGYYDTDSLVYSWFLVGLVFISLFAAGIAIAPVAWVIY
jgi:hypothetical protein